MKSSKGRTIAIRYLSDRTYGKDRHDYYVGTEAIELPTVEELREIIKNYTLGQREATLALRYGYANRNPKDPFVKKIGKDLALSRLEKEALLEPLVLTDISLNYNQSHFNAVVTFSGYSFGLSDNKVHYLGFHTYG
jgi:hypothetical protein